MKNTALNNKTLLKKLKRKLSEQETISLLTHLAEDNASKEIPEHTQTIVNSSPSTHTTTRKNKLLKNSRYNTQLIRAAAISSYNRYASFAHFSTPTAPDPKPPGENNLLQLTPSPESVTTISHTHSADPTINLLAQIERLEMENAQLKVRQTQLKPIPAMDIVAVSGIAEYYTDTLAKYPSDMPMLLRKFVSAGPKSIEEIAKDIDSCANIDEKDKEALINDLQNLNQHAYAKPEEVVNWKLSTKYASEQIVAMIVDAAKNHILEKQKLIIAPKDNQGFPDIKELKEKSSKLGLVYPDSPLYPKDEMSGKPVEVDLASFDSIKLGN